MLSCGNAKRERNQHRRTHEVQLAAGRGRICLASLGKPPLRTGQLFAIRERHGADRLAVHFVVGKGGVAIRCGGALGRMATRANAQTYLDRSFCGERERAAP